MAMNRMAIAGEESNGEVRQGFDPAPREVSHTETVTRMRRTLLNGILPQFGLVCLSDKSTPSGATHPL